MNKHVIPERMELQSQESVSLTAAPESSFQAVVLVHLDAAYSLARYLTRRSDIADDIVQEALLKAFSNFDKLQGENARSWLLAIVRNCFLTWYGRDRKHSAHSNIENMFRLDLETAAEECDPQTPESVLTNHEENHAVRAVIEQLPHVFREVLVLREIEDLSYREIANITGAPMGTVMSRLARARKMFADAWKRAP